MKTELEVIDGATLGELAETANAEHAATQDAMLSVLGHAMASGDALIGAQRRVPHGEWMTWVSTHFTGSYETALTYVRVATYRQHLHGDMTIEQALIALRGLPYTGIARRSQPRDSPTKDEARRLRQQGLKNVEIAALLGVNRRTVSLWLNPQALENQRHYDKRRRAAIAALRERERDQVIRQAVRKTGAATAELYNMAERMQDVLGQAHRETTDREARKHLSLAGEHYRKMRDEIVRALGVS